MVSTPLTLAALATSAVPGLNVHGVRIHTDNGAGEYTSAVVVADDGEYLIQVPRSAAAESRQSGELLGVSALADGGRSRLPFAIPVTAGVTRAGETRAVVSTFLSGGKFTAEAIESDALLLQPLAATIAAIHQLPASLVQQAGLQMRTSTEVHEQLTRLVVRAAETRLLPETVHARWLEVLATASLWDFAPVVIHGSLDADQLLVTNDEITGVLGWSELSTGDPAVDIAWLLESGSDVLDSVLARYSVARGIGGVRDLRSRTIFHSELAVARWLLHGVEAHDSGIVDDAVSMLDRLVDRSQYVGSLSDARPVLSEDEVQQLLEETPAVIIDSRSETAEFDALDEDREFLADPDFAESEHLTVPIEPIDSEDPPATAR